LELKQFKQIFKLLKATNDIEIDPSKTSQTFKLMETEDGKASNSEDKASKFKAKQAFIMPCSHFVGKNIWILKPTGLNRGKGIHVVDNVKKVKALIKQHCLENAKQEKPAFVAPT
jgi:phosphoribosylamine-glycine ligase